MFTVYNTIRTRSGNGNYSFIPDSSFVGTIFVNSISNFCCNVAKNTVVKVESNTKKYDAEIIGDYEYQQTSWGFQINLGNIMYGQNKDVVIKFTKNSNYNAADDDDNTIDNEGAEGAPGGGGGGNDNDMYDVDVNSLNYISLQTNKPVSAASVCIKDDDNGKLTEMNYYRLKSCDVLRECMSCMKLNDMDDAQKKLKDLIKEIDSNKLIKKEKYIDGLLQDLRGQAFEAISKKEYYDKWGRHYLPSLVFAHLHQYNNNFKDPGVQNYGGDAFDKLRYVTYLYVLFFPLCMNSR